MIVDVVLIIAVVLVVAIFGVWALLNARDVRRGNVIKALKEERALTARLHKIASRSLQVEPNLSTQIVDEIDSHNAKRRELL